MSNSKTQEFVNRQTRIYLDHLIPLIRKQAGHETFSFDDAIEYLIIKLKGMKEGEQ